MLDFTIFFIALLYLCACACRRPSQPKVSLDQESEAFMSRFNVICDQWVLANNGSAAADMSDPLASGTDSGRHFSDSIIKGSLGITGLEQFGSICREQHRLRVQFVNEVAKHVHSRILTTLSSGQVSIGSYVPTSKLVAMYQGNAAEIVGRQQLELRSACAVDDIFSRQPSYRQAPPIFFRYQGVFDSASTFDAIATQMLQSFIGQRSR
jgi:hypothetical protein